MGSSDAAGAAVAVSLPLGFAESVFEQPLPMLMVSAPAVSFVSAERVLYLARQLRLSDGTPLLAVAEMPVGSLAGVLVQGMDIAGLEVTLERASGQLLLTMPRQEAALARGLTPPLAAPEVTGPQGDARQPLGGGEALVV